MGPGKIVQGKKNLMIVKEKFLFLPLFSLENYEKIDDLFCKPVSTKCVQFVCTIVWYPSHIWSSDATTLNANGCKTILLKFGYLS